MNKFHQLATKHETYVKRFTEKYSNINEFFFTTVDNNSIIVVDKGDVKIDHFTSKATFGQFVLVLEALGMIRQTASGYQVIIHEFNWDRVFEAIFTQSNDEKIQTYKQSRKIALLYELNLIDEKFIVENNIHKKRGNLELIDIKKEVSIWEKDAKTSFARIIKFLERVKNEYKI